MGRDPSDLNLQDKSIADHAKAICSRNSNISIVNNDNELTDIRCCSRTETSQHFQENQKFCSYDKSLTKSWPRTHQTWRETLQI